MDFSSSANWLALPYLILGVAAFISIARIMRHPEITIRNWIIILLAASGIWVLALGAEHLSVPLELKILFDDFQWIGISLVTPVFLLISLEISGKDKLRKSLTIPLIFIIPALIMLTVATNRFHNLLLENARLENFGTIASLERDFGILFLPFVIITYSEFIIGILNLLLIIRRPSNFYGNQIFWILLAGMGCIFASFFDFSSWNPFPFIQWTALAICTFSIIIALTMPKLRQQDLRNATRNLLLEAVPEPLLLISPGQIVLAVNPAAEVFFGKPGSEIIGRPLEDVSEVICRKLRKHFPAKKSPYRITEEIVIGRDTFTAILSPSIENTGRVLNYSILLNRDGAAATATANLQRTLSLVQALSRVAVHATSASSSEEIFRTFNQEFNKLNLSYVYVSFDKNRQNATIEQSSFDTRQFAHLESMVGQSFIGFSLPRSQFPPIAYQVEEKSPIFVEDYISAIRPVFRSIPENIFRTGLKLVGISEETTGVFFSIEISDGTFGMMAIWGNSLSESDLPSFSIFASQLANAIELSHKQEGDFQRHREADRENALIISLNRVAARTSSSSSIDGVVEILSEELEKLSLNFYLSVIDKEEQFTEIRHTSLNKEILRQAGKLLHTGIIGYQIPRPNWPPMFTEAFTTRQAVFLRDFDVDATHIFYDFSPEQAANGLKLIAIDTETSGMHIPVDLLDGRTAMLSIWGNTITRKDLPTFQVFAVQIANTIERASIYEFELAQKDLLARSNEMAAALSRIAAKTSAAENTAKVLETLDEELRFLKLNYMLVTVTEDRQVARLENMTMSGRAFDRLRHKIRNSLDEIEMRREKWPVLVENAVESEQPQFSTQILDLMPPSIYASRKKIVVQAFNQLGISDRSSAIVIPQRLTDGRMALFVIWGNAVKENDIPIFSVFANQVTNTYEKSHLIDLEHKQALALEHSNHIIRGLSSLASQVSNTTDITDLLKLMRTELGKIGLTFAYLNINDQETSHVEFLSIPDGDLKSLTKKIGIDLIGLKTEISSRNEESINAIREDKPQFLPDFWGYLNSVFEGFDKKGKDALRQTLRLSDPAPIPAIFLPILLGDGTIFFFIIWGPSLREEDLTAFSVYKTQVESILESARLFHIAESEIEERQAVQEKLAQSQNEFRGLFENAHDAIILTDPQTGLVLDANQRAELIFGYSNEEFKKISLESTTDNPAKLKSYFSEIIQSDLTLSFEIVQFKKGDPTPLNFEVNAGLVTFNGRPAIQSIHRDVTTRIQMEEKLRYESLHDSLTGLPNRTLFLERLAHIIIRSERSKEYHFAVLYLDLDRFKNVNDTLGHMSGDKLLVQLSNKLQDCMRASDTIARMGGDEFAIIFEDVETSEDLNILCERVLSVITEPLHVRKNEIRLSGSIGVVLGNPTYKSADEYLRDADIAMYIAKEQGKARFEIFNISMRTSLLERIRIENNLRSALEKDQFHLVYQPIYNLNSLDLVGFEALLRWEQPNAGLISPGHFISIAEDMGLIQAIGSWVLREACRQFHQWRAHLDIQTPLTININVSALQLLRPDFPIEVRQVLEETGVHPACLVLEITETSFIHNHELASEQVNALKDLGVQIHLDDFGTGFSSLNFINLFQVDALKIEREFIAALGQEKQAELVRALIALGENIGLEVFAEGIETEGQLDFLKNAGCGFGQGFYYSKPLSQDDISRLMETGELPLAKPAED